MNEFWLGVIAVAGLIITATIAGYAARQERSATTLSDAAPSNSAVSFEQKIQRTIVLESERTRQELLRIGEQVNNLTLEVKDVKSALFGDSTLRPQVFEWSRMRNQAFRNRLGAYFVDEISDAKVSQAVENDPFLIEGSFTQGRTRRNRRDEFSIVQ